MKTKYLNLFFMLTTVIFSQSPFSGKNKMVLLNNPDSSQFIRCQSVVDANDGHMIHAYYPNIIQGYLTPEAEAALCKTGWVKSLTDTTYTGDLSKMSTQEKMIVHAWNQTFTSAVTTRGGEEDGSTDHTPREVPGKFQTSEYMMGRVAVAIVFVESDGTIDKKSESWDDISKEDMFLQIRKGLDWWSQRGGYRANLSWTYEFRDIKSHYEPITHGYNDDKKWTDDVASQLGFGTGDASAICFDYADDLRRKYKTDWAFVVFAAAADNDADGNWKNSDAVAWANLGGPLLIINNRCDGWGPDRAWQVMAHETGHIFNALDEYPGGSRGDSRHGLLNVINGNAEDGGVVNEPCIMKTHGERACDFTQGQIGWIDANFDGVFVSDYLNLSKRFNQKMMLREALEAKKHPSPYKIEYEDPRVRMEAERNKKFYTEKFDNNSRGWKEDKDVYITKGVYSITNTTTWLDDEYSDVNVTVKTKWEKGGDAYGLDLYSRKTDNFYSLVINADGEVMFVKVKSGEGYYPTWKKLVGIKVKGENTLKMTAYKNTITLFVNDELVGTLEEPGLDQRIIGLRTDESARVAFDDLSLAKVIVKK